MRTHYCGQVDESSIGKVITVAGWAHRRRDHGGVIFVDLRDRAGLVQLVFNPDNQAVFSTAESIRSEFVLEIEGTVKYRPEGTQNSHLKTGKIEIHVEKAQILNPSLP